MRTLNELQTLRFAFALAFGGRLLSAFALLELRSLFGARALAGRPFRFHLTLEALLSCLLQLDLLNELPLALALLLHCASLSHVGAHGDDVRAARAHRHVRRM